MGLEPFLLNRCGASTLATIRAALIDGQQQRHRKDGADQPSAFVATALPAPTGSAGPSGNIAAALMNASFGLLTIVGTEVLDFKNVTVHALASAITISGQLYIAILIGMVLGRSQKRLI